ncbi:mitochondrial adenyl nucleotide antiporter SLC25A23-like [Gadus chalcogrammus]|uniref:mitochondrial adenyl nucleotide antiporter SLC25A23-like n=1 Tax=Gadus chalcogrammus TaxID=1042646 RepID=UPI0024C46224|nr:mitochondrial adenyl nucleotide antiporter SLC25A23-like [Gadus chalcogrammus]XP_056443138.1 mitochondrial adenyl nucleotide antiporter SLC25A23-like [Gadus chalcogrammus]
MERLGVLLVASCQENQESPELRRRRRWARLFDQLDLNKDGRIDLRELRVGLAKRGVSRSSVDKVVLAGDTNQDGELDFEEFSRYLHTHEKQLRLLFSNLDRNHDGEIDAAEIQHSLRSIGLDVSRQEAERILNSMDRDGTMTIDWAEWRDHFLFNPLHNMEDVARYWRHTMILDTGEQLRIPEELSDQSRSSVWRQLASGGLAGAVSRTSTAPLDRLKVFLQVHGSFPGTSSVGNSFQSMVREGGLGSLWRGNGINVLKMAPETAIKFTVYEQIKGLLGGSDASGHLKLQERFIAGSLAGAIAQTAIYPLEVLKTRLTLRATGQFSGVADCVSQLLRREGVWAFYRGYVPNLLAIAPAAGIDLAVYESLKNSWISRNSASGPPSGPPGVLVLVSCGALSSTCGQLASYPLALVKTRMQAQAAEGGGPRPSMTALFHSILAQEGVAGLYRGLSPNLLKVIPAVSISYVVYEYMRRGIENGFL